MADLKCPVCVDSVLTKHNENGTDVDYCEKCGGIWLDKGELNKITHPTDGDIEFCSHETTQKNFITEHLCPLCTNGTKLVETYFIEYSDIRIEYCKCCGGIWLENGELDVINREIDALKAVPESLDHKIMVFLSKLPFN